MKQFNVTIKAEATRMVDDQTGATETITSEFIAKGKDALHATNDSVDLFKSRYTTGIDSNLIGCADLDDFEITEIRIEPHDKEES